MLTPRSRIGAGHQVRTGDLDVGNDGAAAQALYFQSVRTSFYGDCSFSSVCIRGLATEVGSLWAYTSFLYMSLWEEI